jgi:hypothetical protein
MKSYPIYYPRPAVIEWRAVGDLALTFLYLEPVLFFGMQFKNKHHKQKGILAVERKNMPFNIQK